MPDRTDFWQEPERGRLLIETPFRYDVPERRLGMEQPPPTLRGLRHLALRVRDLPRAKEYYEKFFGMKVVWEPDPQNCYLSSGVDNLALHETTLPVGATQALNPLDHFGFIVENPQVVDAWAERAAQQNVKILKAPKHHRDGSYSCYLADPDGNTIQILYEPTISRYSLESERSS
jgi:catechol 2,3-dioxygenase-like lactoylglutathione lyase family enzyme